MLDFITKFFKREEASKTLAKERLRLVLMSDRVSLAPDIFDEMKGEMLAVIRRYLDIDERALDMHFENLERQFALLANIPVLKVRSAEEIRASARPLVYMAGNGSNGNGSSANGVAVIEPDDTHASSETNGVHRVQQPRRRRRRRRATPSAQPLDEQAQDEQPQTEQPQTEQPQDPQPGPEPAPEIPPPDIP